MAYFNPSSRHPDTLICVKNHAVSELQWRNKDLLKLAEQSHALWEITLLTSALPHIKKNGQLAAASKFKKNAELLTSKWQIVTETITLAPEDEQKSKADFSRAGSQGLKGSSFIKVAEIRLQEMSPADSEPQTTAITNPVVPQAEISPHSLSSPVYSPAAISSAVNTSPAQPRVLAKSFDNNSTASSSSWPWLGGGLLVAAAAGGGGGGGGGSNPSNNNQLDNKQLSTDTKTSLQGLVMAGPLKAGHGLTVNVFDYRGQKLATGVEVDASGHFSVSLKNVTGTFVLIQVVVDTDNDPDYVDEASGSPKDLGMNLRAVIKIGTQSTHALSVTPLTELAAQLMLHEKNNSVTTDLSGLSEANFSKYSQAVAKAFGIHDNAVISALQPFKFIDENGNVLPTEYADLIALKYAKALAILSSMEMAESLEAQMLMSTLNQDMLNGKDGKFTASVLKQILADVHAKGRIISRADIKSQLDPSDSIIPIENNLYRLTNDWIPEKTPAGDSGISVGSLQKIDSSSDAVLPTWSVDDVTNFKVDGQQIIFIGANADYENKRYYGITLTSSDGAYSQAFTVKVNRAPTAINLATNLLPENIGADSVIGEFTVTDSDGVGNNVLSLSDGDSAFFSLNGKQLVRNSYQPGNLSKSIYTFKVTSTDGSLVYMQDISLQVNKAPTAISIGGSLIINDGATVFPIDLGVINLTDDSLGTNTLSIAGLEQRFFSIRNNHLFFKGSAQDIATTSAFNFSLNSADGGLVFSQSFTLKINKAPTNITLSNNSINENVSVPAGGVLIGTLNIVDDGLRVNTLSLSGDDAGKFTITGNNLYFTGTISPDYETKSSFSIDVKSTDGNLSLSRSIYINVVNVNEAPTGISLSSNLLPNGAAVGSGLTVGTIQVQDDGLGTNTLSLVPSGDASLFTIAGNSLKYIGGTPNASSKAIYNLTIKATDITNTALTYSQAVTVQVNKAPTAITPTWTINTLPENTAIGSGIELATLNITDDGLGANTLSVSDTTNFSIVNNKLYFIGASPNYETKTAYTFTIKSTDGSLTYTTGTLTLNISNINEAPRSISLSSNTFNEQTSVSAGLTIATVTVTDDASFEDTNTYSVEGTDARYFRVEKIKNTTGTGHTKKLIYIGMPVDYESGKTRFDITIKSTDGPLVYIQNFTINVTDVNEAPTSIYLSNLQKLQDKAPTVVVVVATSPGMALVMVVLAPAMAKVAIFFGAPIPGLARSI